MTIPFNRSYMGGKELEYVAEAHKTGRLAGDGVFAARCDDWLKNRTGGTGAFLTHSGTAALEMAALLMDLNPGDEVIMQSFTFPSTANAFVLRGAVPAFIEKADIIREKGTDSSRFFGSEIDEYCWRDMGPSFGLGELSAAFL